MKRKLALLLFAALVSASLFAGCQNKNTEKPDPSENTESNTPSTGDITGGEANSANQNGESESSTDPEQKTDATETAGYAEAYLEVVNAFNDEHKDAENIVYNLIDFDGKGSKELVIYLQSTGVSMYTYADGKVYTVMDGLGFGVGGITEFEYIPGSNLMRNYDFNFAGAICYENYYQINEKKRLDYLYDQVLLV